jgi:hypothetical protein
MTSLIGWEVFAFISKFVPPLTKGKEYEFLKILLSKVVKKGMVNCYDD